jgi:membrane-bound metal-dependent hydrolase YbcI (DUF457 family)
MNTQTHALMGAALFGSTLSGSQTAAAVAGGLAPDLPMILMVAGARWIAGHSLREIFGRLYFSERWQAWLAPWHSVPLWSGGLAAGWWISSPIVVAFAASGLVHAVIDIFLHADDAHQHFWPFSAWRFRSPVSYWDPRHHGRLFQPFELALAFGFTLLLLQQYHSPVAIAVLCAALALYSLQIYFFLRALRRRAA